MKKIMSWLKNTCFHQHHHKPHTDVCEKNDNDVVNDDIYVCKDVWDTLQKIDSRHEYQYLEMPDGSVAYHAWLVTPCEFFILHPSLGIAHYVCKDNVWDILRCDHEMYKTHINTSIQKNYPAQKFSNFFTLSLGSDNMKKKKQREIIWNKELERMQQKILHHATWSSFKKSPYDDYAIIWIEKSSFDHCPESSLEQYYVRKFLPLFLKTQNKDVVSVMVGFDYNDDVKTYRHMVRIPTYFLEYPFQDWVKFADYYANRSDAEYALLYGNDLPLTPELLEIHIQEENHLMM